MQRINVKKGSEENTTTTSDEKDHDKHTEKNELEKESHNELEAVVTIYDPHLFAPRKTPKTTPPTPDTWGSSSSIEPTWGRRKEEDHDERLKNWMNINTRPTREELKNAEDPDYQPRPAAGPQDFGQTTISHREDNHSINLGKINHDARDDAIEFERIPIAGEYEEDYDEGTSDDDEIEEEEDEVIPIVEPIPNPASLTQGYLHYETC
jgi:hypothetical protein